MPQVDIVIFLSQICFTILAFFILFFSLFCKYLPRIQNSLLFRRVYVFLVGKCSNFFKKFIKYVFFSSSRFGGIYYFWSDFNNDFSDLYFKYWGFYREQINYKFSEEFLLKFRYFIGDLGSFRAGDLYLENLLDYKIDD